MLHVAFVGALSSSFADCVQMHLTVPCEITLTDESKVVGLMPRVDVVVTLAFTEAMGAASERLKLVQVPGAGLDRIARSAIPPGAALANAYGHETGIAEFVLGAMLAMSRGVGRLDAALRRGIWESQWRPGIPPPPVWPELAGRTLGIAGYGRIGSALAKRGRAFEMTVCAIRRSGARSDTGDLDALGGPEMLPELLQRADYLVLTLPLTPETRGLVSKYELGMMKPTAFLVNVSRAGVVDEEALYTALRDRRIAGAALDVWYRYPTGPDPTLPANFPFHELPNVLMTPHVSGWTDGMLDARARVIAENIQRVTTGRTPLNLVSAGP
jgi:phosphoglycerate dehydrogenase-like enzyme